MIPLSQLSAIVGEAVKQALASQQTVSDAVKPAVAKAIAEADETDETDSEGGLYGNQDKKKQFDLTKLLPGVTSLPKDKVIIVIQKNDKLSDGTLREDETGRRVQILEPGDYLKNTTPDKSSGQKIYDVLFGTPGEGGGFVTVHKPQ